MKIYITGVAGFIGFHLANKLITMGYDIYGIDNLNAYYDIELKNSRLDILKKNKNFHFKKIDINNFKKNLYTKNMPDPEILIRTGGHQRLSNFMLWQLAYAELFFLKKLWPDFQISDLKRVIKIYNDRIRNFGAI